MSLACVVCTRAHLHPCVCARVCVCVCVCVFVCVCVCVHVVPGIGRGIRSRATSSSLPGGLPLVSNASSNTPASSSPDASSYTDSTNTINGSSNSTANTTTTTNNNGAHSTTIINATGTTTHTISLNELSRSVFASNGRVSQSPNASHQSGRGRGRVVVRGSLPTFSTSEISETNLRFTSLSFDTGTAAAAAAPVAAPVAAALTEASSSQVPLNTTATPVVATTSAAAAVTTVTPVPLSSNRSSTFSSHATVPAGRPVSVRRQSADIAPAAMAAVASAASPPEPARPVQSVQQQEQKQQPPSKSALVRSPSVSSKCRCSACSCVLLTSPSMFSWRTMAIALSTGFSPLSYKERGGGGEEERERALLYSPFGIFIKRKKRLGILGSNLVADQ